MIHARPDYQRFQDPALDNVQLLAEGSHPIAIDEPVILFRAQDKHFVDVLTAYKELIKLNGNADQLILDQLDAHIELALHWQEVNGCKDPDSVE